MLLRLVQDGDGNGHPGGFADAPRPATPLRAVVLLAGSVRATDFRKAAGRAATGLPVAAGRSVLDIWREQLNAVAAAAGAADLPVRIIVDPDTPMQPGRIPGEGIALQVEQDPKPYRGPGGLLRDLASDYDPDDRVLVGHASQLLLESLAPALAELSHASGDVAIACDADGSPAGLMLVRVGCLTSINTVGFIDLNEQALPQIAREHDVRVVHFDRPLGASIRTMRSYIEALRAYHRRVAGQGPPASPLDEDWRPSFTLSESGASVHESAVVHDSVVLGGARVEAGAVLVRSVACPGAVVGRGRHAVDELISGSLLTRKAGGR